MLKRPITYTDFNGETTTETFYFNLTKTELFDLEVSFDGGLEKTIKAVVAAQDVKKIMEYFQRIVLICYGEKSDDGKRFIKNDEIREGFRQSAAYDVLFMELATNENAAVEFLEGVLPFDLVKQTADKPLAVPPPAPPTTSS